MAKRHDDEAWAPVDTADQAAWKAISREIDPNWRELLSKKRVIKADEIAPVKTEGFQIRRVDTSQTGLNAFISFFEEFPPKGVSQRHGHMNEAVFYILEGKGYEIHDEEKFEWEAGDVVIIPAGCVHRHVNSDPKTPAKAIVINPTPLYKFMNLTARRLVNVPGEGSS